MFSLTCYVFHIATEARFQFYLNSTNAVVCFALMASLAKIVTLMEQVLCEFYFVTAPSIPAPVRYPRGAWIHSHGSV